VGLDTKACKATAKPAHAMQAATKYFEKFGNVDDVHGNRSYDLVCNVGSTEIHIEVKGTTTDGTEVILTPNEVVHASTHLHVALFVLSNIKVERNPDGVVEARGGKVAVHNPWAIDKSALSPIGFKYTLPALS
jgi:hypothetical protein